nr:TetR/AcrR family transcriptional regulator [Williamsia sp.]
MVNTGRPRDSSIDDAILDEAARMIVEIGYGATTIDAVARAAGTTRPAVYRRYASLAQIVSAAMSSRVVFDPRTDCGDLPADLDAVQKQQIAFFTDPLVIRAMPGLIEESSRNDTLRSRLFDDIMTPRRAAVRRALDQAAHRGDIAAVADSDEICDLLTGPLLLRTLMPALGAVDTHLAEMTVAAALESVGYRRADVATVERS